MKYFLEFKFLYHSHVIMHMSFVKILKSHPTYNTPWKKFYTKVKFVYKNILSLYHATYLTYDR